MGGGSSKDSGINLYTWNIAKGEWNLKKLLTSIPASGRTVICFQEVNSACEKIIVNKFKSTVVRAGEAIPSGKKWYLLKPSNVQGWIYNLTLTNICPSEILSFNIPEEARHVLSVGIKIRKNIVFIYNIHLLSGRDKEKTTKRKKQLKTIYKKADEKGSKQIITGDFNLITDEIPWPPTNYSSHELVATYCKSNPANKENKYNFNHPFDRCIAKGVTIRTVNVVGVGKGALSDHYGLSLKITG